MTTSLDEGRIIFPGTKVRLDPEMYRLIMAQFDPSAPTILEQTPEQARAAVVLAEPTEPIGETRNLEAPGPNGPTPVREYRPVTRRSDTGIVFFHGGGWVLGSVAEYEDFCRRLSNVAGRPVFSVEYSLAPEHKFPRGVQDCYAGLQWVAQQAATLEIDGDGIFVAGDSAGGNLAAIVSYLARERSGPRIKGQILIYPVASFGADAPSIVNAEIGPWLTPREMAWFRNHYLESDADESNPEASPLMAADFSGLPPTLVINAEYDPLRDDAREYAAQLIRAGVSVRYREYPGTVHGFLGEFARLRVARDAFDEIGAFVDDFSDGSP